MSKCNNKPAMILENKYFDKHQFKIPKALISISFSVLQNFIFLGLIIKLFKIVYNLIYAIHILKINVDKKQ